MPVLAVVGIGLTVAAIAEQQSAARKASNTAAITSIYNNKLDQMQAQQVDQDSSVAVQGMREDAEAYVSKQRGQYAAAGIVADTGSPLAIQAETAGKLELRAQHAFMESSAKQGQLYSEGAAGLYYGRSEQDQISEQSQAATLTGAARIAGMGYQAYQNYIG